MNKFDAGQKYAAKKEGERWKHIASLSEGDEIAILTQSGVKLATFQGVVPRNRRGPILVTMDGELHHMSPDHVVIDDDYHQARDEYLQNLLWRVTDQPFNGLRQAVKLLLLTNDEVLSDRMCYELRIPRGSTIGYSVQHGKHLPHVCTDSEKAGASR